MVRGCQAYGTDRKEANPGVGRCSLSLPRSIPRQRTAKHLTAAETRVTEPGLLPGLGVEHVAGVDDARGAHQSGDCLGIERRVFGPFRHEHGESCKSRRLIGDLCVQQLWMPPASVVEAFRVGHHDVGAEAFEAHRDIECGGVAHVVGVRLERHAEHGHLVAEW